MSFMEWKDYPARTLAPGFHARMVHTDNLTMSHWDVEQNATLPEHQHPHEQVSVVLEGEFELTVDGESRVLRPGSLATIPSNSMHGGRALTPCRILDIFYPVREDYR
jgi:quercetin dioxygenase-like cupin family protein